MADVLTVARMGYGAMQLAGPGLWGPPKDRDEMIAVLRTAAELGVNHVSTATPAGGRARLAAAAGTQHPAHLRHFFGRPPARQHRRRRPDAALGRPGRTRRHLSAVNGVDG
jgi:hypothetical protein